MAANSQARDGSTSSTLLFHGSAVRVPALPSQGSTRSLSGGILMREPLQVIPEDPDTEDVAPGRPPLGGRRGLTSLDPTTSGSDPVMQAAVGGAVISSGLHHSLSSAAILPQETDPSMPSQSFSDIAGNTPTSPLTTAAREGGDALAPPRQPAMLHESAATASALRSLHRSRRQAEAAAVIARSLRRWVTESSAGYSASAERP